MKFIGVDLAWGYQSRTGLCATEDGKVEDITSLRTDDEIVAWLEPRTSGPCVVGIDAPLIVTNMNGRRRCETLISRAFGRYHAGAHSSNLSMLAFATGARALRLTERLGLNIDPASLSSGANRVAIEVYPHPAIVALFDLATTLKYKAKSGGSVELRRASFALLVECLERLRLFEPSLDVANCPRWHELAATAKTSSSPSQLDLVEDQIDACLCAYVAEYFWNHGRNRCRVVGDVTAGYIVTPVTDELGKTLDRLALELT